MKNRVRAQQVFSETGYISADEEEIALLKAKQKRRSEIFVSLTIYTVSAAVLFAIGHEHRQMLLQLYGTALPLVLIPVVRYIVTSAKLHQYKKKELDYASAAQQSSADAGAGNSPRKSPDEIKQSFYSEMVQAKENAVKQYLPQLALFLILGLVFFILLAVTSLAAASRIGMIARVLCVPCGIALVIATFRLINLFNLKGYTPHFKERFVRAELARYFQDVMYKPLQGIRRDVIKEVNLISLSSECVTDDYISASYRGIRFEQSDLVVYNTDTGRQKATSFVGRWIILYLPKRISGELYIIDKRFRYPNANIAKLGLDKMQTEDIGFNSQFEMYGSIPHDLFYLLTPHVMQNIMAPDHPPIAMYMRNNEVHIAMNADDAFELDAEKSMDEMEQQVRQQICLTTRALDMFAGYEF